MTIQIYAAEGDETTLSTSGRSVVPYTADGSADRYAIEAAAVATIPSLDNGRILDSIKIKRQEDNRSGLWDIEASYKNPTDETSGSGSTEVIIVNELGVDFDIQFPGQHLTHSLETISSTGNGITAPDFNSAINVDSDGNPQGVEIGNSQGSFQTVTIIQEFLVEDITNAYISGLRAAVGKTNSAIFRSQEIGEVLFLGASGSVRYANTKAELSFNFAFSENVTGKTIGPFTSVDKKGWEYVWIYSGRRAGTSDGKIQPLALYVEKVHESDDFTGLGISTS